MCFPKNIAEFFRNFFFTGHPRWLLLNIFFAELFRLATFVCMKIYSVITIFTGNKSYGISAKTECIEDTISDIILHRHS